MLSKSAGLSFADLSSMGAIEAWSAVPDAGKAQEGYRSACEMRFRPACDRVREEP